MTETLESEFGPIAIYRRRGCSRISFRMGTNGQPKITAPLGVSKLILKRFLSQSHQQIAQIIQEHRAKNCYLPGMVNGKTNLLKLEYSGDLTSPQVKIRPNFLVVRLPFEGQISDEAVQAVIRPQVQKILRQDARQLLIPRLEFLAKQYGFCYQRTKLSHASTRWGSCSSKGVITLNIGLASLPNQLIDYVIVHELCHLCQMNHSSAFWAEVAKIMPDYAKCETVLKKYSPHL